MNLLRACIILVGIASMLSSCSNGPNNWTQGDPLDRFDQPPTGPQLHGEVGVNASTGF